VKFLFKASAKFLQILGNTRDRVTESVLPMQSPSSSRLAPLASVLK